MMATSSIFHNVILNDPKQVEAFVSALEASEADPYVRPEFSLADVLTDKGEILRLHELRMKNRDMSK